MLRRSALLLLTKFKKVRPKIKPSNITVTGQGFPKVMDFGIARQIKDTASRLTRVDSSGTMAYMAPEQELGRFDERCLSFDPGGRFKKASGFAAAAAGT